MNKLKASILENNKEYYEIELQTLCYEILLKTKNLRNHRITQMLLFIFCIIYIILIYYIYYNL